MGSLHCQHISRNTQQLRMTDPQALAQVLSPSLVPLVSVERQPSRSQPTTNTTNLDCFPPYITGWVQKWMQKYLILRNVFGSLLCSVKSTFFSHVLFFFFKFSPSFFLSSIFCRHYQLCYIAFVSVALMD